MTAARRRRFAPEANRAAILSAAESCFLARGYAGTSMSEIAKASGVTKSLIHHHFGSKQALWKEVKRRRFDAYHEQQMKLLASPELTPAIMKDSMEAYFRFLLANPETLRLSAWMQLEGDSENAESVIEMRDEGIARIRAAQDAGVLRSDIEAPFMLVTFLGMVQAWFTDPVTKQQKAKADDQEAALGYLDSAWKIFATGVSAVKG